MNIWRFFYGNKNTRTSFSKTISTLNPFIEKLGCFSQNWEVILAALPLLNQIGNQCDVGHLFFCKWAIPGPFFDYLRLFKQIIQFLQQINAKNVYPVYCAGIRTHFRQNLRYLPLPLDQGSHPIISMCWSNNFGFKVL